MKQQQLTFEKGITNIPSDLICSDHCLEKSEGMIYRDGEHHVVQKPKVTTIPNGKKLIFVHKTADGEKYIYETTASNVTTISYYNGSGYVTIGSGSAYETINSIVAIGNTLIVSFGSTIKYYLYSPTLVNNSNYTDLGDIPEPKVKFRMGMEQGMDDDANRYKRGYSLVKSTGDPNDIIGYQGDNPATAQYYYIKTDNEGAQTKYDNLVVGLYAKNQKSIKQKKGFCEPFCARVALEMYDGSYTKITNPVVLLPTIRRSSHAYNTHGEFSLRTRYSFLYCHLDSSVDYTKWSDIVKDVVVFISDGVNIYDTAVEQPYNMDNNIKKLIEAAFYSTPTASDPDFLTDGVAYNTETSGDQRNKLYKTWVDSSASGDRRWFVLQERPENKIQEDIASLSIYYRLCSLGRIGTSGFVGLSEKIDTHTLENLTTQETLPNDDYYSHCKLKASFLNTYNSRLNMAGVERGFFEGFEDFLPYDNASPALQYTSYVTIKTPSGDKIISHTYTTQQKQELYFYYPDPRATHVTIMQGTTCMMDLPLKEHQGLNGAYALRYLPGGLLDDPQYRPSASAPSTTNNNDTEKLGNYLLNSEVNNPFVFQKSGYHKVGDGKIVGMASQTQALSQGQFGQYPLMVFTTEGIWALSLDNTGQFVAIHPMSREVALENNPCILPVDGAVFFVSKKGLMVVSGSTVKCVSEQLSGKTNGTMGNFCDYLASAFMAYDYRDSLIWIFDGRSTTSGGTTTFGSRYCYIYSIKSGTFGSYDFGQVSSQDVIIENAVNNYPDYLIQRNTTSSTKPIFTLLGRDDINVEAAAVTPVTYSPKLITRPLKLENGLALKSLVQIKHICSLTSAATQPLTLVIKASNDAKSWVTLSSLRGLPWKYYKFEYTFTRIRSVDTFAGTIVVTEERRTNKLR